MGNSDGRLQDWNFRFSETGSLETASSSGESVSRADQSLQVEKTRVSARGVRGWVDGPSAETRRAGRDRPNRR